MMVTICCSCSEISVVCIQIVVYNRQMHKQMFRVRSRDCNSNSHRFVAYDDLKQKKILSQRQFELNYGSVRNANLKLRQMIRKDHSIDCVNILPNLVCNKQNISTRRKQLGNTVNHFKENTHTRDNLTQQLIKQENQQIWNRLQSHTNKVILYRNMNIRIEGQQFSIKIYKKTVRTVCIKLTSINRKVVKYLNRQEWESLWKQSKQNFDNLITYLRIEDGALMIKLSKVQTVNSQISEDISKNSKTDECLNEEILLASKQ